jgi:type IV fimbrial biogenesis protein FimT
MPRAQTSSKPRRIPSTGFSLLELMMVLTIAGILISIAIPNYRSFLQSKAVQLQIDALTATFRLARSEALRRGQWVVLCRSTASATAQPTCSSSAPPQDWATGWLLFVDQNGDGAQSGDDAVIHVQRAFTSGVSMIPSTQAYTARYRPDGIAANSGTTFVMQQANPTNKIIISAEGRVRVA